MGIQIDGSQPGLYQQERQAFKHKIVHQNAHLLHPKYPAILSAYSIPRNHLHIDIYQPHICCIHPLHCDRGKRGLRTRVSALPQMHFCPHFLCDITGDPLHPRTRARLSAIGYPHYLPLSRAARDVQGDL